MIQFIVFYGRHSGGFLQKSLKCLNVTEKRRLSAISSILFNTNKIETETSDSQFGPFDKEKFDNLVHRCYVYDASYGIYGGCRGLTDLGPIGSGLKSNILQLWRQQFVLKERMLEIDCPSLTIPAVFKASGHLQRFTDYIVKDVNTGEGFRLDHLIKSHLEQLITTDNTNAVEYEEILRKVIRTFDLSSYISYEHYAHFSFISVGWTFNE